MWRRLPSKNCRPILFCEICRFQCHEQKKSTSWNGTIGTIGTTFGHNSHVRANIWMCNAESGSVPSVPSVQSKYRVSKIPEPNTAIKCAVGREPLKTSCCHGRSKITIIHRRFTPQLAPPPIVLVQINRSNPLLGPDDAGVRDEFRENVLIRSVGSRSRANLCRLTQPVPLPFEATIDEPCTCCCYAPPPSAFFNPRSACNSAGPLSPRVASQNRCTNGTSRRRRQIPWSLPRTCGLWLVTSTIVCDGRNDQKSSRMRRALMVSPPVNSFTCDSDRRGRHRIRRRRPTACQTNRLFPWDGNHHVLPAIIRLMPCRRSLPAR